MYLQFVKALAENAVKAFREMTGTGVIGVDLKLQTSESLDLPIAQVIQYEGKDAPLAGVFVLGFDSTAAAKGVAGALAAKLGLPKPETLDEDAIDMLGEFMNVVVGRTISDWDSEGMPVVFGPPGNLQQATVTNQDGYKNESYLLSLRLALSQLTFSVTFCYASEDSPSAGKKILVVDDSRTIRKVLASILEKAGFTVEQAEDGLAAIDKFKTSQPDLVIMDLVMPQLGGLEAIMRILEISPRAKLIVLSSSDRTDEVVTAKTLGVLDYLIKPVNEERLLKTVASALNK